jgi:hypothetical protein
VLVVRDSTNIRRHCSEVRGGLGDSVSLDLSSSTAHSLEPALYVRVTLRASSRRRRSPAACAHHPVHGLAAQPRLTRKLLQCRAGMGLRRRLDFCVPLGLPELIASSGVSLRQNDPLLVGDPPYRRVAVALRREPKACDR